MTVIVTMILLMFGLNPVTGKQTNNKRRRKHRRKHTPKYRHTKHDHTKKGELNYSEDSKYVKSKISDAGQSVLDDMTRARTYLPKDPL